MFFVIQPDVSEEDGVIRTETPALDITENSETSHSRSSPGHIDHRHIITVGDP